MFAHNFLKENGNPTFLKSGQSLQNGEQIYLIIITPLIFGCKKVVN